VSFPCSTNARERIPDQHIYDSAAPVAGCDQNRAGRLFAHLTDHLGFFATGREAQGVEGSVGIFGRDYGYKLAFICNVQRIQP
jgi:hypothetical protein